MMSTTTAQSKNQVATEGADSDTLDGQGRDGSFIDVSDAQLIAAIARRHNGALAEAFERHGGCVHGLVLRLCGPQIADSLTRQVFLELWRSPPIFDATRGAPVSYTHLRAHETVLDLV